MRKLGRRRLLALMIAIAASVVVVLLVLIGIGILRLPTPSPPSVTVDTAVWHILQGNTSFGFGWFGPSVRYVNNTGGLPLTVSSGSTFTMEITLSNLDNKNHTIYNVSVAPPFLHATPVRGIGVAVVPGSDEWYVVVSVEAPTVSSDSTYELALTLNALA